MSCQHLIYDNRLKGLRNCKCKPKPNGYCKRHQKFKPLVLSLQEIITKLGAIQFPNDNNEKWEDAPLASNNSSYSMTKINSTDSCFTNMQQYITDNFTEDFSHCSKRIELISMERRQHPLEYYEYFHKRKLFTFEKKDIAERSGFHGCHSKSLIPIICEQGLKNQANKLTHFGRGVYVATRLEFSTGRGFTAILESNSNYKIHHVFFCKYFTGKFAKGNRTDPLPPLIGNSTNKRYDSTTDNIKKPVVFSLPDNSMVRIAYSLKIKIYN